MKIATFASLAAVATLLLAQPAWASDDPATGGSLAPGALPAAALATYAPESPVAAFERLFASRPVASLPRMDMRSDGAFERHFQLALWSTQTPSLTLAAAHAGGHTEGVRP